MEDNLSNNDRLWEVCQQDNPISIYNNPNLDNLNGVQSVTEGAMFDLDNKNNQDKLKDKF